MFLRFVYMMAIMGDCCLMKSAFVGLIEGIDVCVWDGFGALSWID